MLPGSLNKSLNEFRQHWKHYILQSLFATFIVFFIIVVLYSHNIVLTISLGSSTFLVFARPSDFTSRPRNIIGGYCIGLLIGGLSSFLTIQFRIEPTIGLPSLYAVAVGLTIFAMVVLDFEHSPAVALALGIAITGISWKIIVAVVFTACVLSVIRVAYSHRLRDLV